jgi:hypothetical protein
VPGAVESEGDVSMAEERPSVILDLADTTLHRASSVHLTTQCGITLDHCQVGPLRALVQRSARLCTACWSGGQGNLFDQLHRQAEEAEP